MISKTPAPPYYAVIFTSTMTDNVEGYNEMNEFLEELAKHQEGYLGIESARDDLGISVTYWKDLESITKWKMETDHLMAQQKGRTMWYERYKVRISKVERDYEFGN